MLRPDLLMLSPAEGTFAGVSKAVSARLVASLCGLGVVWWFREHLPPWALMWLLAVAIFAGAKWLTWRRARRQLGPVEFWRSLAYLCAWPGMDAGAFLNPQVRAARPALIEWCEPAWKIVTGVVLLWTSSKMPPGSLAAGWLGMFGLICILHFGVFFLLSLGWRSLGVAARPLMNSPLRSHSLSDLWGRRWNAGFNHLAHELMFRPLSKIGGATLATGAVFMASGLIHDLVISLPAGGGFGLPTAYFILQGAGLLFERSRAGRRLGLGRGAAGWLFTLIVAGGPAYWLFHPPFVTRVMNPFLHLITNL